MLTRSLTRLGRPGIISKSATNQIFGPGLITQVRTKLLFKIIIFILSSDFH